MEAQWGRKISSGTESRTEFRLSSLSLKGSQGSLRSPPTPLLLLFFLLRKRSHSDSSAASVPPLFSCFRKSDWLVFHGRRAGRRPTSAESI